MSLRFRPAVIVGREITMSALREWAATMGPEARSAVAVNAWGKWKTATQVRRRAPATRHACNSRTQHK